MKQPELGLKITEFRKEKGLTQQELVDLCNINVRTIQRIEAGEVTPRSYTVKSILGALGKKLEDIKSSSVVSHTAFMDETISASASQKKVMKLAVISGAVFLFLYIAELFVTELLYTEATEKAVGLLAVYKIVLSLSLVFFYYGFFTIGAIFKNDLLKFSALAILCFGVLANMMEVVVLWKFEDAYTVTLVFEGLIFGAIGICFGIALYQLKSRLGNLLTVLGIGEVFIGALLLSVVFQFVGAILSLPLVIIEIVVLYHVYQKLKEYSN